MFVHPPRSSGISKQAFYKRLKVQEKQEIDHQKLVEMVKDYRKKVGSKTGGIKLHKELKQDFMKQDINPDSYREAEISSIAF